MIEVIAGIIINDGTVLIAKRKREKSLGGKWEFPGGKIEVGETPAECLERELREEFQIETRIGKFFAENTHAYDTFTVHLIAYEVEYVGGEFTLCDHDEIAWVPFNDLLNFDMAPADIPLVRKLEARINL